MLLLSSHNFFILEICIQSTKINDKSQSFKQKLRMRHLIYLLLYDMALGQTDAHVNESLVEFFSPSIDKRYTIRCRCTDDDNLKILGWKIFFDDIWEFRKVSKDIPC